LYAAAAFCGLFDPDLTAAEPAGDEDGFIFNLLPTAAELILDLPLPKMEFAA
jgi:hypothetical protein